MGHIAEAGVWKGSSLLMFAKLTRLFEPEALTQVHGFDWFRGNHPEEAEKHLVSENSYFESKERLEALIRAQRLDNVALLHELDLSKDLDAFFSKYAHLQFKLVFLDCGLYPVVRHCIEYFWERLTPGGILLLDNINHETAPGETLAVREMLPGMRIHTFPFTQQPTGYIVKPAQDAL
jgi:predicted O-methyltransferase YrrM